jgi:hypothetical protein
MMSKLDWRRCQLNRPRESKYGDGALLPNGERAPVIRKDDLARRADQAMRAFVRRLGPRDRQLLK